MTVARIITVPMKDGSFRYLVEVGTRFSSGYYADLEEAKEDAVTLGGATKIVMARLPKPAAVEREHAA